MSALSRAIPTLSSRASTLESVTSPPPNADRRTFLRAAVWSAPVIAIAMPAPAASASPEGLTVSDPVAVLDGDLVNISLTVTGLDANTRLIEVHLGYTNGISQSSYEVPILTNGPNAFGVADESAPDWQLASVTLVFTTPSGARPFIIPVA